MIKGLDINNFRCFGKTKIRGFTDINLIGGKNNAGKTALLEALFLNLSPGANAIESLRRFRRESLEFAMNMPEMAWNNLYFNLNVDKPLTLISYDESDKEYNNIEIVCDKSPERLKKILQDDDQDDDDLVDLRDLLTKRDYTQSTLNINQIRGDKKHSLSSLIMHSKGMVIKDLNVPLDKKKANYIPASVRLSGEALAREYDKADIKGNAESVLKSIQIIDDSIKEVKTFTIGKPSVYMKREEGEYLHVYLYGEAISKTTDLILRIINDPDSVLLIDEIENGIHHENQLELWKMIFKLSSFINVQMFVTTHSQEMAKAFVDAGLSEEEFKGKTSYFELTRSVKSGELVGIKRDLKTLKYEMDQGMGFRGE